MDVRFPLYFAVKLKIGIFVRCFSCKINYTLLFVKRTLEREQLYSHKYAVKICYAIMFVLNSVIYMQYLMLLWFYIYASDNDVKYDRARRRWKNM